jgi:hypothetical protein
VAALADFEEFDRAGSRLRLRSFLDRNRSVSGMRRTSKTIPVNPTRPMMTPINVMKKLVTSPAKRRTKAKAAIMGQAVGSGRSMNLRIFRVVVIHGWTRTLRM